MPSTASEAAALVSDVERRAGLRRPACRAELCRLTIAVLIKF